MEWHIYDESTSYYYSEEHIYFMDGVTFISDDNLFRTFRQHFSSHRIELQQIFTSRIVYFIQANSSAHVSEYKGFAFRLRYHAATKVYSVLLYITFWFRYV
jgi:hypothetical protein